MKQLLDNNNVDSRIGRNLLPKNLIIFLGLCFISSCQTKDEKFLADLSRGDKKQETYIGHYKESNLVVSDSSLRNSKLSNVEVTKLKIAGSSKPNYEIGLASWYGAKHKGINNIVKKSLHGKKTANGDIFNTDALTAAHRTLPIPSVAKITNLVNNKSIIVMINDRGPYHKNRILDVSSKVASILDFKHKGISKVKVEHLDQETKELLNKLSLKPEHGSKPTGKIKEPICSINCFIKLVNLKHGYKIE